jgi:hypothetical protein
VPQDDYYSPTLSDPLFFGDPSGFNVMVSDQSTPSAVPEPGALGLTAMIFAVAVWRGAALPPLVLNPPLLLATQVSFANEPS